jgi:hypothetical protein
MLKITRYTIIFLFCLFPSGLVGQSIPDVAVKRLPQYDALFVQEEGWTGADGAYSVALSNEVTVWFFGDTWIGQIKNGRHLNAVIVNNSLAVQRGKNPITATVDFYYDRKKNGQPQAFFRPSDGRGWFWLYDGVLTEAGLYVFLIQVERTTEKVPFNFKVIGTWLGHISNPEALPTEWRVRQSKIPWANFSDSGDILFGSAILRTGNFFYIYGTAADISDGLRNKSMIVARVPVTRLADFNQWRFYANGKWVSDFTKAGRLCEDVANEYSVSYVPVLARYVVVYSQDGISKSIMARSAPQPHGPWSDPFLLYQCKEADWHDTIFCYAAKAHSNLADAPAELIVTYIANSLDFKKMASDVRLYRPRFLRVSFKTAECR